MTPQPPPNYRSAAAGPSAPCGACGQMMDAAQATYSKSGALLCPACTARETIAESGSRASKSALYAALTALGFGLLSIPCNFFFLFSFFGVVGGIVSIRLLIRPEFRSELGAAYPWMWAASIGAIVTGMVQPAIFGLVLLASMLGH